MRFTILMFSMLSIALPLRAVNTINRINFKNSNRIFDKHKRSFEREHLKYLKKEIDVSYMKINLVKEPSIYCYGKCASILAGLCRIYPSGNREIFISRSIFNSSNNYEREELIFHELAHCVMNIDHRNVKFNGEYISLMGPKMFSTPNFYKNNREGILLELFTGNIDGLINNIKE